MKKDVKVGKSKISGKGVFANRSFKPGETVLKPTGNIVHYLKVNWDALANKGMDYLQVSACKYLEPTDSRLRYLNHSCNPNLGYRNLTEGKRTITPSFFALKPIRKGQEVKLDYSTVQCEEWERDKKMSDLEACACKSKGCRGVIGDFTDLPKADQRRYIAKGAVPDYILKRVQK